MNLNQLKQLIEDLRRPLSERRTLMYEVFSKKTPGKLSELLEKMEKTWNMVTEETMLRTVSEELIAILATAGSKKSVMVHDSVENLIRIRQALKNINNHANSGAFRDNGELARRTSGLISWLSRDIEYLEGWYQNMYMG